MFELFKNFNFKLKNSISIKVDSDDGNISLDDTIVSIKERNSRVVTKSKNLDYERNLFLYELGFVKMKRVVNFIDTMSMVGNIEEYKKMESKYIRYGLTLLNKEMLESIKSKYVFNVDKGEKFEGDIPNKSIDEFKKNYLILKEQGCIYTLYKRYYTSNPYAIDKSKPNDWIEEHFNQLKHSINTETRDYLWNSYYYKISKNSMFVYYKNNNGMVIIEVEKEYYLILSQWCDESSDGKMNFKDFIKTI